MHWIIYLPTLKGEDIIMVSSGDAFIIIHFRLLLLQLSLWVLCLDRKIRITYRVNKSCAYILGQKRNAAYNY